MNTAVSHILVVDDSPVNIQDLARALTPDHEVHFVTTGLKALEFSRHHPVDLILLDVSMPGIDGFETCRQLKADLLTRNIPVIFVTAALEVQDETLGFEVGAVDYITKPISTPIVRARVRTHLELKAQRDKLQQLSLLDGLTGIANRRHFDETLQQEWRRSTRHQSPLSLLLMDIDHFKHYNDHYGHLAGDECLRQVAHALATLIQRPGDLVARYGGEEFAIILSGCDPEGAQGRAAHCVAQIAALNLPHAASSTMPHVTLSVGAASALPQLPHLASLLVTQADRCLYQAKAAGRNGWVHDNLILY